MMRAMKRLSPEIRRIVIQYAAKENLTFHVALECLIAEGFKAVADQNPAAFAPVYKSG